MLRRILKVAAIVTIVGATALTSVETAAYASPAAKPAVVTVKQGETLAAAMADPQIRRLAAAVRHGATVEIKTANGAITSVKEVGDTLVTTTAGARAANSAAVTPGGHRVQPHSWCTWAVTGAIWGLGAAALTTIIAIALLTPGVDVITIVGVTLSIGEWSAIAAVMGSFSAVYNLVAAWVC